MGVARRLTIGLTALGTVAVLVVGVPALLLLVGFTPARAGISSWADLMVRLQMPDNGTMIGLILTVAAWAAWAYLVSAIVVEAVAAIRRIPTAPLPVLSLGQIPARRLVAGIALLFVTSPALAAAVPPSPAFATPTPTPPPTDRVATRVVTDVPVPRSITVERGDTLSELALEYLGDGGRWDQIYDASTAIVQPDGRHLTDPDEIDIGWTLNLPDPRRAVDSELPGQVTVEPHDSLSKLAEQYLGAADRWPEIYAASTSIEQPGGRYLSDPDHIEPGWTLRIPTDPPAGATPPVVADPPEPDPESEPEMLPTPSATSVASAPAPSSPKPSLPQTLTPSATAGQPTPTAAAGAEVDATEEDDLESPAWLVAGLAGAGALLAGSVWLLLSRRRKAQFRARRPGRTIVVPPADHADVEKTLMHDGGPTADVILQVDQGLRQLAAGLAAAGDPVPVLLGVDVTPTAVAVLFFGEVDLPSPWQSSGDRASWWLDLDQLEAAVGFDPEGPPPWPQLVTIGRDDDDVWRLVNLETLGVVSLTGDPARATALARYLAAELATAPWARDVTIDCVGVCGELAALNPVRLTVHDPGSEAVGPTLAAAAAVSDRLAAVGVGRVETARVQLAGEDLWESQVLIADPATATERLARLTDLVTGQPGRTATSVLLVAADQPVAGVELRLDASGRVEIPAMGLILTANGLTAEEALGCAAVLSSSDDLEDVEVPLPADPAEPWQELGDVAGNLRGDVTLPRGTAVLGEESSTMLPGADEQYVAAGATTVEDLAVMSPVVPASTRERVERALSSLDEDLAAWYDPSCSRPRLQMLGPLKVRPGSGGKAQKVAKRFPYYGEIVAFLAEHPRGATTQDLMAAFGQSESRIPKDMSNVREWLGLNPRTGRMFLPQAKDHPEANRRGVGLYLVEDLLVDAHLFRQLRERAKTRSGDEALRDLLEALRLVQGAPFDGLRDGGHAWLAESRTDQNLHVAIVDTAHEAVTAALAAADIGPARLAAELAWTIAPYETTAVFDLATVMEQEGQPEEAQKLIRAMANWTDGTGDGGPIELPERAKEILRARRAS